MRVYGEEHRPRNRRVQHAEIEKGEHPTCYRADEVHLLPTDAVRDVAEERSRDHRNARRDQHGAEDEGKRRAERMDGSTRIKRT